MGPIEQSAVFCRFLALICNAVSHEVSASESSIDAMLIDNIAQYLLCEISRFNLKTGQFRGNNYLNIKKNTVSNFQEAFL